MYNDFPIYPGSSIIYPGSINTSKRVITGLQNKELQSQLNKLQLSLAKSEARNFKKLEEVHNSLTALMKRGRV